MPRRSSAGRTFPWVSSGAMTAARMPSPGQAEPSTSTRAAPELSVVLPVYNEGETVAPVLRALHAGVRTAHELVVVYDFDGDTTVPVIARLAPEIPGLRGLRNDLGR